MGTKIYFYKKKTVNTLRDHMWIWMSLKLHIYYKDVSLIKHVDKDFVARLVSNFHDPKVFSSIHHNPNSCWRVFRQKTCDTNNQANMVDASSPSERETVT